MKEGQSGRGRPPLISLTVPKPRFLVREEMKASDGMESDSFSGPRQRWRVKPERDSSGNGGFDFTEFQA